MEQDLAQEFRSLAKDTSFISKNANEFGKNYTKKFIAVFNGEVIAVSNNFDEIMEKIKQKKLNPSLVLIEYIPSNEEIVLY